MTIELRTHPDAASFIEATRAMWEPREVELNLLLGLACSMRDGWRLEGSMLATLERDGRPISAALRTPPHGFVVAEDAPGGAAELARALRDAKQHLDAPTVVATSDAAEAFARAWTAGSGSRPSLLVAQRICALREVIAPPQPPGRFRAARAEDAEPIAAWLEAFTLEATPHDAGLGDTRAIARDRIERGLVFVWELDDERLVSMAALARPTPSGITINTVYTPPASRGHGYATACVAALSRRALDAGRRFACLYTDASNPTSNAIYERIGYRLVCESALWSLS